MDHDGARDAGRRAMPGILLTVSGVVAVVSLAPVADPPQVASAIAQALGIQDTDATSQAGALKDYVNNPVVTVIVVEGTSPTAYVVGEVNRPGPVTLQPNMTVLQALSSAGFTQFANTKGIYILRTESGKQVKIPVNYRQLLKGEKIDQMIMMKPRDTIVVP